MTHDIEFLRQIPSQPGTCGTVVVPVPKLARDWLCDRAEERSEWQRCPVCEGRRTMPHGWFSGMTMATSTEPEKCLVCNGTGMVPYPDYGQPDAHDAANVLSLVASALRGIVEAIDKETYGAFDALPQERIDALRMTRDELKALHRDLEEPPLIAARAALAMYDEVSIT